MRVATVQGGKFKVSDEGDVWKLRNGEYVRATITRTGEKNNIEPLAFKRMASKWLFFYIGFSQKHLFRTQKIKNR